MIREKISLDDETFFLEDAFLFNYVKPTLSYSFQRALEVRVVIGVTNTKD